MIDRLIISLQQAGLILSDRDLASYAEAEPVVSGEDIADVLWLASWMERVSPPLVVQENDEQDGEQSAMTPHHTTGGNQPPPSSSVPAYVPETTSQANQQADQSLSKTLESGLPIEISAAPALPDSRLIGRALRPLMRKVPSLTQQVLDESETVSCIAERDIWVPVLRPARERWFDLELVIEASTFGFIWESTLEEFQQVLERQGAFRNVRTWRVKDAETQHPRLVPKKQTISGEDSSVSRSPKELIDPSGRRLLLFVSDCRSMIWKRGIIHDWLKLWSQNGPTAIVQLLPERLWAQTELDVGFRVQVGTLMAGVPNHKLLIRELPARTRIGPNQALTLPVVTLTQDAFQQWAMIIASAGQQRSPARLFDLSWVQNNERVTLPSAIQPKSAEERVELFEATASPIAQRLAGMMAAVPVSLPVVNLIQKHLLKEATPVHVAEVFSSDLIKAESSQADMNGELMQYDFVEHVRGLLNERTSLNETMEVLGVLSEEIARTLGFKIKSFTALLFPRADWSAETKATILPFAQIATQVLSRLGGEYAELARMVERDAQGQDDWIQPSETDNQSEFTIPEFWTLPFTKAELIDSEDELGRTDGDGVVLKTDEFTIATIDIGIGDLSEFDDSFEVFEFTVAILVRRKSGWENRLRESEGRCFFEELATETVLEMVAIPGGTFLMGSPENEPQRRSNEGPQHDVTVEPFFMGRYPVTQAQWRVVAEMNRVKRTLEPDPSKYKGADRPVERVSWYDAVEFCDRLSRHTGKDYRLPTEAEWEYACRANTKTPFHFGETISPELANYRGTVTYNDGPKGEYRKKTTPIHHFQMTNAFGLHDMHGNVWEWCQDHWHDNYKGAPTDGSAWLTDNDKAPRISRGGSWGSNPRNCRSAYRFPYSFPDVRTDSIGFRVVCSAPRTLQAETR